MKPKSSQPSLAVLLTQLVELIKRYLKAQLSEFINETVAAPVKKIARFLGFTIIFSSLMALAFVFFTIALVLLLAKAVGSTWLALIIISLVLMFMSILVLVLRGKL
jgi:uncharacterized membrane protein